MDLSVPLSSIKVPLVEYTSPVTSPVKLPVTDALIVAPATLLLKVIPGLIVVNPGIAGVAVNVGSLLTVANITLPNFNFIILCVTPLTPASLTVSGIAPASPCALVYSGPINLYAVPSYRNN